MGHWTAYLGAAALLALVIRVDAKVFGPYFSLSNVVTGFEGLDALYWHERKDLQRAYRRRLAWPLLAGFAIAWMGVSVWDAGLVTLVGGLLLLWPMVFHGLPAGVPRRSWLLPALYSAFLVTYALLGASGALIQAVVVAGRTEGFVEWAISAGAAALICTAAGLVASTVYAWVWRQLRQTWERNMQSIYDVHPEHDA